MEDVNRLIPRNAFGGTQEREQREAERTKAHEEHLMRNRREFAIIKAIDLHSRETSTSADKVLESAKKIEAYLKGEST